MALPERPPRPLTETELRARPLTLAILAEGARRAGLPEAGLYAALLANNENSEGADHGTGDRREPE